jgi:hypothetical protein
MSWLVTEGQDLSTLEEACAKLTLLQYFRSGDSRTTSVALLAYDKDDAPKRSEDSVR